LAEGQIHHSPGHRPKIEANLKAIGGCELTGRFASLSAKVTYWGRFLPGRRWPKANFILAPGIARGTSPENRS
jgi:hypothetical protein